MQRLIAANSRVHGTNQWNRCAVPRSCHGFQEFKSSLQPLSLELTEKNNCARSQGSEQLNIISEFAVFPFF